MRWNNSAQCAYPMPAHLQHSDVDHHFGLRLVKVGDQFLRQYHLVWRASEGDRAVRGIYLNPADVQNSFERADHLLELGQRRSIEKIICGYYVVLYITACDFRDQ